MHPPSPARLPRPLTRRLAVWALLAGAAAVMLSLVVLTIEVHARPTYTAASTELGTTDQDPAGGASQQRPARRRGAHRPPALRATDPWE